MHGADAEDFSGGAGQRGINALLLKKPHGLLAAQKRAGEVHIHHPLPLLEGEILKRGVELDAGVVHQDVQPAKLDHGSLKHAAHLLRIRHIRRHGDGPRAAAPHFLGHFERLVWLAEEIDDHVRSRMPKRDGDGPPDTRGGTGDEGGLALKQFQNGAGGWWRLRPRQTGR